MLIRFKLVGLLIPCQPSPHMVNMLAEPYPQRALPACLTVYWNNKIKLLSQGIRLVLLSPPQITIYGALSLLKV